MWAAISYLLLAIVFIIMGWQVSPSYFSLLFYWTALSLLLVSGAYFFNIAKIFRKRENGVIPFYIRWAFIPFLLGAQVYNAWSRKHDKVPPLQQINEHLFLACRLFPSDIDTLKDNGITAILDVTCEFDGLEWSSTQENINYLNIPVLDHRVPTRSQLNQAINWIAHHIKDNRRVVVHCALGRGRSVFVMAAYLLSQNKEADVHQVLAQIKETRETANLNKHQLRQLVKRHRKGELLIKNKAVLIANPVSGTKLWQQKEHLIVARLSAYYNLKVMITSVEKNGIVLAKQAIADKPDMIIACGGDGTVAEVASVLVNTDCKLGIIPFGTANALAHVLMGIKSKLIPVEVACDLIIEGQTKQMDTAYCNGELMLLLAGIGFEQHMIEKADRDTKNELGQFAYLQGFWQALGEQKAQDFTVQLDDNEPQQIHTNSLIVANAAPFTTLLAQGGGQPDHYDGLLDVNWLTPNQDASANVLSIAELVFSSITQAHFAINSHHTNARRVAISATQEIKYVLDGEVKSADKLIIEITPQSLAVICAEQVE
ncbi:MAG: diacylglycerol kinase (ATP) [Pseudoalteromonas rhizosphaerae]|jgi:diacylglycerol kinase (ATP)|uniref:Diacylglycerol kinase n=1 Tax=Pseudoalteromonas neustonica TaxID=1840331 RepID=A0ABY3FJ34_9GAMM|nr:MULTISPECIES: diacylglycerol kinase family protein [Pseudoalteromonas]MBB1331947.1 dual specificity protein phosphatase family protein [Pseudoalteromonas sp. SR41-6]MBB1340826.1 dual specificity protein phosphatase family protein [Pseudoalteromonas sp. SR45-6]MBB1396183.1 dual specificity protein phosphatase family protein [Pseudoalteromonas sp. SG44-8]MBB1407934.1 dual specificity protein phosphatase family protein [Pseudoalteromonas sp. SG44-17]MBB1432887.1 dual specificity protein phosph|tara:strand:+ start:1283 stop:2908 length:1626 start_codon:yes stop_codon:yes gene_type:complete